MFTWPKLYIACTQWYCQLQLHTTSCEQDRLSMLDDFTLKSTQSYMFRPELFSDGSFPPLLVAELGSGMFDVTFGSSSRCPQPKKNSRYPLTITTK